MSPNAVAKTLKAEGWFSPKTTVYYIEIASGVSVKRARQKTSSRSKKPHQRVLESISSR